MTRRLFPGDRGRRALTAIGTALQLNAGTRPGVMAPWPEIQQRRPGAALPPARASALGGGRRVADLPQ